MSFSGRLPGFLGKRQRDSDDHDARSDTGGLFVTPEPSYRASVSTSTSTTPLPYAGIELNHEFDESDDDDSGVDDSDPTYNQSQETLPHQAAYDERTSGALAQSSHLASTLSEILNVYSPQSKPVENMAKKATPLLDLPEVKKPKIMLLGDTGTGLSIDHIHAV